MSIRPVGGIYARYVYIIIYYTINVVYNRYLPILYNIGFVKNVNNNNNNITAIVPL